MWLAYIYINSKMYKLGRYLVLEDAVCARLAAEQCLNWNDCDDSSSAYQFVTSNILRDINNE